MSSQIKEICNSIQNEQWKSIRDLTSGHLNENHLYHPRPTINGVRKPTWSASQKSCPTLRPPHRLTTHSNQIEQMKESLIDFTYLTLPERPARKTFSPRRLEPDEKSPRISLTKEPLPPIVRQERIQVPSFSIDLTDKQKMKKMKHFNENVLQKSDTHLHGLGYSEDFVTFVEDNLRLKLLTIESQNKRQTLSLNRLQAYSEALIDLIEGSPAFGIVLERIKDEYDLYLEHLLSTQPEFGIHVAEQLKRLRQAQPNFSAADAELFDIERIENQTRESLERNRQLHEELRRIKQEQIDRRAAAEARLTNIPTGPTEIRIKTQAEQIDEMRESVFDLLDRMTEKKEELSEKCVPLSICTQLQQAIRDTEMDIIKTKKQNETLINELTHLEEKIRKKVVAHDQTEFAEENVRQILDLLKKIDLLHLNKIDVRRDKELADDDQYFLHTYNDYFS